MLAQFFDPSFVRGVTYVSLFLLVAPLFPFVYLVLRWRAGEQRDIRGLGTYGALLYFRTVALLLAVAGAANLTYGMVSTTPVDEALTRLSWGLFTGSLVFLAINLGLGRLVELGDAAGDARRMFGGFLMVLAGLVAGFVLVLFFITVFEKVDHSAKEAVEMHADTMKLYGCWVAYYLGVYIVTTVFLTRRA